MDFIIDTKSKVDLSTKFLRISVNDNWWPDEIVILLDFINKVYNSSLLLNSLDMEKGSEGFPYYFLGKKVIKESSFSKSIVNALLEERFIWNGVQEIDVSMINLMAKQFRPQYQLQLLRINYNSPGSIDLLGIGKIVEQVKDLWIKLREQNIEKRKYRDGKWLRDLTQKFELEKLKKYVSDDELEKLERKLALSPQMEEARQKRIETIKQTLSLSKELGIPFKKLMPLISDLDAGYEAMNMFLELDKLEEITIITDEDEQEKLTKGQ